jgi:hypothetical protein
MSACVPSCNCPASVRCGVLNTSGALSETSFGVAALAQISGSFQLLNCIRVCGLITTLMTHKNFGGDEIPEKRKVCGLRASKQMLKHYSHIRIEAKRTVLESIVRPQAEAANPVESELGRSPAPTVVQQVEG